MAGTTFEFRDDELAAQIEAVYATSPGALAGTDMFKHTSGHADIKPDLQTLKRDKDKDNSQASVLNVYAGRRSTKCSIQCNVVPNGGGTPAAPDASPLFEAVLGSKHVATAHTTTAAGSTTTVVNFASGGFASSGSQDGDLIAIDIDGTGNYEARRIASHVTDAVTLDRALSGAPTTGRAVKVGCTYRLSEASFKSLFLWLFNGNTLRWQVPGLILPDMTIDIDHAQNVPLSSAKFTGEGTYEVPQSSTSRPTPTTHGQWLTPALGKLWIEATKYSYIKASLHLNNGLELRKNESGSLQPTGPKRTANGGRYVCDMTLDMFLTTGTEDVKTLYDNAALLTTHSVLVQLGSTPGQMLAWTCPNWFPTATRTNQGGEDGVQFKGMALGTTGDDELTLGFL